MIRNVEAVYVNGGLKLVDRLPLRENERERVSIDQLDTPERPAAAAAGRGEARRRIASAMELPRRGGRLLDRLTVAIVRGRTAEVAFRDAHTARRYSSW